MSIAGLAYFGNSARISGFLQDINIGKRSPQAEEAPERHCAEKPQRHFGERYTGESGFQRSGAEFSIVVLIVSLQQTTFTAEACHCLTGQAGSEITFHHALLFYRLRE